MTSRMASVAPLVTDTIVSGSTAGRRSARVLRDGDAQLRAPTPGAYWLTPPWMALSAASLTASGPSKSGNPCPRFTALCLSARALNSEKTVVPKRETRWRARAGSMGAGLGKARERGGGSGPAIASTGTERAPCSTARCRAARDSARASPVTTITSGTAHTRSMV